MASASTLGPVSSSIHRIYDVFLSFRGEDTRSNFVDHLHAALKRKGIISFKDDEKLERGKVISEELMQAIRDSEYAIVVISKKYAFSKWCLMELTKIMKCKSETGLKVWPIFYNVDPSDVRKQKSSFGQAFDEHEKDPKVSMEDIETWKTALNDVGNLSGWHIDNSSESVVIENISQKILESRHGFPNRFEGLVGIVSRVEKIIALLRMGSEDVRILGICGMGGIGKTTLARAVYNQVSSQFEARCFVVNVREETKNQGLPHLQTQIIYKILQESGIKIFNTHDGIEVIERRVRNKNVFIVLDDVDLEEQLKALVGSRNWFSPRSRVILTSRDQHLLKPYVDEIYELEQLSTNESLELFSQKAFKKDQPIENYMDLSKDIVGYAQGLPLAFEVFGSYLYGRPLAAWEAARKQLKVDLIPNICKILKISYDGLMDSQKELFLDIAYLFKGRCGVRKVGALKSIHPFFDIDIEVLKDRCLIKGSNFEFCMHDLLREMGQQIVYQESRNEPRKRRRLNSSDCIYHISRHDLATDAVEKIVLQPPYDEGKQFSFKFFSKMTKLKMLAIGSFEDCDLVERNDFFSPSGNPSKFSLSNKLCFLQWPGYPLESLPITFQSKNLVEFRMPYSRIKGQWGGWKDGSYEVVVGTAQTSGIPDWFNRRITSSFETIDPFAYHDCYALLILYEVHEHGSSNNGTSDGSTRTPQFVCQFQFNKIGPRKSLLLCAPKVPFVGLNGLWVLIAPKYPPIRRKPKIEGCLEGSIESCSLNMEVRECGARSVCWEDFSEFSEVINSTSPYALDFKGVAPWDDGKKKMMTMFTSERYNLARLRWLLAKSIFIASPSISAL